MLLGGKSYTFGSKIKFQNDNGQTFVATVTDFGILPPQKGRGKGKPGFFATCTTGKEMWGHDDWIQEVLEQ